MPPISRRRNNRNNGPSLVTTTTILDLNEYCLLDIFALLSPSEMAPVYDTCKRFREVAEIHMRTFYRSNELTVSNRDGSEQKIMCKFGAFATKMKIEFLKEHHQRSKDIASRLRKLKPTLESLTLTDTNFNAGLMLSPLLGNVRQLRIEYVVDKLVFASDILTKDRIKQLLKSCSKNVEELSLGGKISIHDRRYQGVFLQQKFKRIRSLELYDLDSIDVNNLKLFLKLNPTVQRISVKRCMSLYRLEELNLSKGAPNIEAVALKFQAINYEVDEEVFFPPVAKMLTQLKELKFLALDTSHTNVTHLIEMMAKRNSLTHLSLTNVKLKINKELDTALSKMTNLTVLWLDILSYVDGQDFYKRLCKRLVNLAELHLCNSYTTNEQIGHIIENAVNLKKIYFPPNFEPVEKETYGKFVAMQSRKNVPFPLTFCFDSENFSIVMFLLHGSVLNHNVINVAEFDLTDFDNHSFPRSAL